MRHFICLLWLFTVALMAAPARAVTFSCNFRVFPSCPALNPDNGHYYAQVFGKLGWLASRDEAASLRYRGMPGYLATITTPEENKFLKSFGSVWIGGSDAEVEGEWRWVTGPEAGQLFWKGDQNGDVVTFADWYPGEPNNDVGPEDYANYRHSAAAGWNDLPENGLENSWSYGYLVEFSPVPEPSTYALATIGLIGMAGVIRKRKRR